MCMLYAQWDLKWTIKLPIHVINSGMSLGQYRGPISSFKNDTFILVPVSSVSLYVQKGSAYQTMFAKIKFLLLLFSDDIKFNPGPRKHFTVGHCNIRGIRANLSDLRVYLTFQYNIDCIYIIWTEVPTRELKFLVYNWYRSSDVGAEFWEMFQGQWYNKKWFEILGDPNADPNTTPCRFLYLFASLVVTLIKLALWTSDFLKIAETSILFIYGPYSAKSCTMLQFTFAKTQRHTR